MVEGRSTARAALLFASVAVALAGGLLAGCSNGGSASSTTTSSSTGSTATGATSPGSAGTSTAPETDAKTFLAQGALQVLCSLTATNGTGTNALSRWSGLGTVDPSKNDYQLPLHPLLAPQGSPLTQTLLVTGGGAYLGLPFLATFAKGKSWIDLAYSTPDQVLGIAPIGLVINPLTAAQVVSAAGIEGSPLKPTSLLGTIATPYDVVVPATTLKEELAKAGSPPIVQQLASSLNGSRPLTIELWFSASGALLEAGYTSSAMVGTTVHQYSAACVVETKPSPKAIVPKPAASATLSYEQYVAAVAAYNKRIKSTK